MAVTMMLFTRDLRVHDNPALAAAAARGAVIPLFVLDENIVGSEFFTANKAAFLSAALAELDEQLGRRGGRLVLRHGDVATEVSRIVEQASVTEVHVAADVSTYSRHREDRLQRALAPGCELHVHPRSVTISEPGDLTPLAGADHFSVFTPFYRKWSRAARRQLASAPAVLDVPAVGGEPLPDAGQLYRGRPSPLLRVGGESTARKIMDAWLDGLVDEYETTHDDLGADTTSRLSPYLHFGCLSATELARRSGTATAGRDAFVRQLAWRDFHHQVLAACPAAAHSDYRGAQRRVEHDPRLFDAWRHGRTGYPVVDAGMRQLAAEGWMHNRARLITASFLTKTMGLDWRLGARHFQSLLVDADVANNSLNWQWVAGTGTDTRPYRTLNPVRQAQRYDARGDYVRRWVPELEDIGGDAIHAPWELTGSAASRYVPRVVDHHVARARDSA